MIILSNSSKRKENASEALKRIGFDPQDFSEIITSGEVSHRMLRGDTTLKCSSWPALVDIISSPTRRAFVLGSGDGDEEYCLSSGWTLAPVEEADIIIARGTFTINDGRNSVISKDKDEMLYLQVLEESLSRAAFRKVPMLVTNPDKVRPDKGLPPMPGAIGDSYEKALGGGKAASALVKRIGKPFSEVYELALGTDGDPSSAIMVGDALETDVTGGTHAKCATLWVVKDGIHGTDLNKSKSFEDGAIEIIEAFHSKKNTYRALPDLTPTFITPHFRW